jgi:hypothetical protein
VDSAATEAAIGVNTNSKQTRKRFTEDSDIMWIGFPARLGTIHTRATVPFGTYMSRGKSRPLIVADGSGRCTALLPILKCLGVLHEQAFSLHILSDLVFGFRGAWWKNCRKKIRAKIIASPLHHTGYFTKEQARRTAELGAVVSAQP